MPGLVEANGPNYISQHSADVILSDVRPFKLKTDALRAINVFLDEILYNILSSSNSLVPDRLRASLLGLLPTSLGKEALLEAEVELRAYWERTAPAGIFPSGEDDRATFHLPFAFELLRNKCEAYSTLNEADEDPSAEVHINERFSRPGASPPKAALVAPAALYLTAILEAICEHVLSNVGRVAARDSSRTTATVNDLFTALCEDASIYGYFRTLKVYDQIEHLSKAPKSSRRSKSFTRNDRGGSISRTSTPHQDPVSGSLSRQSSESSSAAGHAHAPNNPSRSSFEKARAMRMFTNSKQSGDHHDLAGHKKTTSTLSENSRHDDELDTGEDTAMQQEFDDLMRSESTMKMSLTPDRLKTMEVYKQEKVQRGNRRVAPLLFDTQADAPSSPPPRPVPQKSSLRHVDSIVEDEEEGASPKHVRAARSQQANAITTQQAFTMPRSRSISTSGAQTVIKKPLRTPPPTVPSAFPARMQTLSNSASNPNISYTRAAQAGSWSVDANAGAPARKRTKQRNRESMDLDDIMNGTDDEEHESPAPPVPAPGKRVPKVSSTTRELMDFLAEGPPDAAPRNGPADYGYGASTASFDKPKGNRLQRMISKLNIGNEKPKPPLESPVKSGHYRPATGPYSPPGSALSPLANRPIPPRPPRPPQPISPPSSPSQVSLAEEPKAPPPQRKYPSPQDTPHHATNVPPNGQPPSPSRPIPQQQVSRSNSKEIPPSPKVIHHHVNGNGTPRPPHPKPSIPDTQSPPLPVAAVPPPTRKPVPNDIREEPAPAPVPIPASTRPAENPAPTSIASEADLRDLQRRFANATSADECRLIFDMFLTRSGVKPSPSKPVERKAPYPSPNPSLIKQSQTIPTDDNSLETSVVELLLGESGGRPSPPIQAVPSQPQSRSPSPPKPRRLPQVPKPEPPANGQVIPMQREKEQEKSIPIATWKNTAEFPTHATSTLIPA